MNRENDTKLQGLSGINKYMSDLQYWNITNIHVLAFYQLQRKTRARHKNNDDEIMMIK